MLKKVLFAVISLLVASSTTEAKDIKEALREYVDNMESIEDAREQLEKQITAIEMIEGMSQIQSIKITSGNSEDQDNEEDIYMDDDETATLPPSVPSNLNGDSIRIKFAGYFKKNSFRQQLFPPQSTISMPYEAYDINSILGTSLLNIDNLMDIIIHKVYYANGTSDQPNKRISVDEYYTPDNAKFIDSIQMEAIIYYPVDIKRISLSKENPTVGEGENTIQLNSIKGREADIALSQNVYDNLIAIQARDKQGKAMDHISKSSSSHYSPAMSAYFQEIAKLSQTIIKNIDDKKYTSLDELKKDMIDRFSIDVPQNDQSYTMWVLFKNSIDQIDIYYVAARDSVKLFTSIVNRDLKSPQNSFFCANDPETYKYGIVDNSGNWVIEPQYYSLSSFDNLFFVGYKDVEDENYLTYKLDIEAKALNKYKYYIKDTLSTDYYLITETDNSEKRGIMDKNENIIIPISKEFIYSPAAGFFIIEDTKAGLYDNTGKVLLPEIYSQLDMVGKYIYATKYEEGRRITTIFDTSLNQITKDSWDAQNKFSDHSDLVLIEDEDKNLFYINKQGDVIISPSDKYIFSEEFWSGSTIVYSENSDDVKKYGYINEQGETIIEPQYNYALPFQGEYAYVEKNGKAMLIDKNNHIYKTLPLTLGIWGYVLDTDPAHTQYRLEDDRIFDGYGNYVKDM